MKVSYFDDTDTLYIEFIDAQIHETRELDDNTLLDVDSQGRLCALTVEHASRRADIEHISVQGLSQ